MGVGIELLYRTARLNRPVDSIPWNQFLDFLKIFKIPALSWFLFHGMVWKGIPRVYFYAWKGIPSCILFRGMVQKEFREFASILVPRNGISSCVLFRRRELWEFTSIFVPRNGIPSCFLFRGRIWNGIPRFSVPLNNGIPSEITICSVYSVFRGIFFLSEIPNPTSSMCSEGRRNHLNEVITPLLPTGIGERYSQTISNLEHAVLLHRCELPL
jgi:hypothetical protein